MYNWTTWVALPRESFPYPSGYLPNSVHGEAPSLDVMVHTCKPNTQAAETGRLSQIQGHLILYSEFQNSLRYLATVYLSIQNFYLKNTKNKKKKSFCLHLHVLGLQLRTTTLGLMSFWGLNPGSHAHQPRTLWTEFHPQPHPNPLLRPCSC